MCHMLREAGNSDLIRMLRLLLVPHLMSIMFAPISSLGRPSSDVLTWLVIALPMRNQSETCQSRKLGVAKELLVVPERKGAGSSVSDVYFRRQSSLPDQDQFPLSRSAGREVLAVRFCALVTGAVDRF